MLQSDLRGEKKQSYPNKQALCLSLPAHTDESWSV